MNVFVRSLMVFLLAALTAAACDDNGSKDGKTTVSSAATRVSGASTATADVTPVASSAEAAISIDLLRPYCQPQGSPPVRFDLSATTGLAVCQGGGGGMVMPKRIYRTRDGGSSWTLLAKHDFGIQTPIADVGEAPSPAAKILVFQDESNGWMGVGSAGPGVYRTRDGGFSWSAVTEFGNDISVRSISFASALEGAIVTYRSTWVTEDGGEHWTRSPDKGGASGGRSLHTAVICFRHIVRELSAGKPFLFSDHGDVVLRGFEDPVRLYEVRWGATA